MEKGNPFLVGKERKEEVERKIALPQRDPGIYTSIYKFDPNVRGSREK